MDSSIVMFRDNGERRSFSITREVTLIGRREDCDFRIPLGEVSRKHCRLVRNGDSFRIEDLGSSNGTYVNGKRVQQATLNAGDTFQVGPLAFVLQIDGKPEPDSIRPVRVERPSDEFDPSEVLSNSPDDSAIGTHQASDDEGLVDFDFGDSAKTQSK